uniref:Uncharacterized protein n=1 Tax=Zea mays TaxID=4577 RepID=C4IZM8_MAIZE|nr:unknown [Zea mays]
MRAVTGGTPTWSCWCRNLMYPEASCRTEAVSVCTAKAKQRNERSETCDHRSACNSSCADDDKGRNGRGSSAGCTAKIKLWENNTIPSRTATLAAGAPRLSRRSCPSSPWAIRARFSGCCYSSASASSRTWACFPTPLAGSRRRRRRRRLWH